MREKTFQFPVPPELLERFQAEAKVRDMSAAQLLRQLMRGLLDEAKSNGV